MSRKNKDSQAEQSRSGQTDGRPAYLRSLRPRGESLGAVKEEAKEGAKEVAPVEQEQERETTEDVELYRWRNWLLPRRPLVAVFVIGSFIGCMLLLIGRYHCFCSGHQRYSSIVWPHICFLSRSSFPKKELDTGHSWHVISAHGMLSWPTRNFPTACSLHMIYGLSGGE